mgnify:CR=1 FL=1
MSRSDHPAPPERPALPMAALIVVATLAVSILGGLVSAGSDDAWYANLNKAPLTPPDITFAIVWPLLYLLMAIAAIRVRLAAGRFEDASAALGLFFVQLVPNLAWSYAFFGFHQAGLAMLILVALWALVLATAFAFWRHDRIAALLLLPYFLWVSFAGYLNGWIVATN